MNMLTRCRQQLSFLFFATTCCLLAGLAPLGAQDNWPTDSLEIEELTLLAWQLKNPQPDSARVVAEEAIRKSDQYDFSKGRADGLHILGLLEWSEGDMTQALTYYLDALNLRLAIEDSLGLGRSYNNIGNVYFQLEQFDSAQVFYERGLGIRQQLGDVPGLIYSYSNLGDIALKRKELFTAEYYYERGQGLASEDSIFSALAHIGGRLGDLALAKGDIAKSQATWEQAVQYAEKAGNRRLLAGALQKAVRLGMQNNQLDIVSYTLSAERSITLAAEVGAVDLQAEAAILLAQLAAADRDFGAAYEYQTQYQELMESLIQEQKNDAVMAIREQYLAEQQVQQSLDTSEALSRQNFRLILWLLTTGLVLIGIIFAINYRAYRKQSELVEKLEAKNQELDARYDDLQEFAKIASHDLKEPVRNIGAFANLIERRYAINLDDKGMEYLEFIMSSAHQMNELLDDLLTFSSIPRYEQEALQPTFLHQLVGEVVAQKKKEYGAFEFVGTTLPTVYAYPELVEILLTNLIDNSLKFNAAKLKRVEMGYRSRENVHLFWIADNGLGIAPAYHEQVFDIFSRLGKRDQGGTGMGLAISKRIIETHRGRIWIESGVGEGTRLYFTIPRHSLDGATALDYQAATPAPTLAH